LKSIILLHGALGAQDQLESLSERLSDLDYDVFLLSFSGHYNNPFEKDFGIHQFSKELKSLIEEFKLVKPNIFGYSMGGYVALYLASQEKNLIGNIITLGTKFNWTKEIADKEIKQLNPKTITEKVPKFAAALQKRHGNNWELLLNRTADMMVALGENNLLGKDLFSIIENKVLIALADGDNMVSIEETDFAQLNLKNSERLTLKNTKHSFETVNTKELVRIIDGFSR